METLVVGHHVHITSLPELRDKKEENHQQLLIIPNRTKPQGKVLNGIPTNFAQAKKWKVCVDESLPAAHKK